MEPPSCIRRPRKDSDICRALPAASAYFFIRPAAQVLVTLFVQCETDFQGHLPFADFTLVDVSAGLAHLEPPHVANRLLGARQCILYSLFESVRRRTNYFNLFVNVIGHTLIISRGNNRTNKKPCAGSGRRAAPAGRRCAARLLISNFALQAHLNSGSLAVCENRWPSRY